MKKKINVLKKGRKYLYCEFVTSKFKFKLVLDKFSEALTLGKHDLVLEDLTVSTKWGTDYKFRMRASLEDTKNAGITTFSHFVYNSSLAEKCRELGGKWDCNNRVWVFSSVVSDEVEKLELEYNTNLHWYEIEFLSDTKELCDPLRLAGYTICSASGRDTGAKLGNKIILVSGEISSSGSSKNWYSKISGNSIIRLAMSEHLADVASKNKNIKIKKLEKYL